MNQENRFDGIVEFAETARVGSFTAAATTLGITASAVGKSVTRLEARLGTKLIHRTTRSLTLTNDGERFLASCLHVLEELDGAESSLATGRSIPVGRVRIDLPGAFGRQHVLPVLIDLSARHPRLDLSVMFSERTVDIVAEGTDLAVRIGELRDDAGLAARRLGTQRLLICASPSYLAQQGEPHEPEELMQCDCITGWRGAQPTRWLMRTIDGRNAAQQVHVRHEFSDGEAMVEAVLAGCGLCQLPTWLIADHLKSGALVPVLAKYAGGEMPIHAVWAQSRYIQPKLRVLIDALVSASQVEGSGFTPET
jgi:DNA-binding transcriptional LysR family regulator